MTDDSETESQAPILEVPYALEHFGEGMMTRGIVVGTERVDASAVPAAFPYDTGTDDVLAVDLELADADDQLVRTFFEWPETGIDERLARLCAIADISADDHEELVGTNVVLRAQNGYFVPALSEGSPRGSARGYLGILLGLAPSFLLVVFWVLQIDVFAHDAMTWFILVWAVCTFLVLPVSLYVDGWYLRTKTDWRGSPRFWALVAIIPPLYVIVVPMYLIMRENARPIAWPQPEK